MGTSGCCVPRILARHCSQSHHSCFFVVGVVVGVVVIVAANANTAAQGRWGCWLAIVAAVLRLVIAVVVLVDVITIAWDNDNELSVILLRLVRFSYVWRELVRSHLPPLILSSRLRYYRFSQNICSNVDTYKVGTYIIRD
jgi:hypothetical protein